MNYLNKDNILTTNLPISGKSSNNIISNRFVSFDETDDLSLLINIFTLRGDFLHQVDDVNYKIIDGNVAVDMKSIFETFNILNGSYKIGISVVKLLALTKILDISPDRSEIKISRLELASNDLSIRKNGYLFNIDNYWSDSNYTYLKLSTEYLIEDFRNIYIVENLTDEMFDTINIFNPLTFKDAVKLKGPRFDIDVDSNNSEISVLKNWEDLLATNTQTAQEIIDSIFQVDNSVTLNIDWTYFENFIFYSKALERVENFHNKIIMIEDFNSKISDLSAIMGSEITQKQYSDSILKIVKSFDSFERYLYYTVDPKIFTHETLGPVRPWPKYSVDGSTQLYPSSNPSVISWFTNLKTIAVDYDKQNLKSLWYSIPEHILMNAANSEYILFVEMIGQHFDNIWLYMNALTDIHNKDEHPERGPARELLTTIANSFGWKLENTRNLSDLWLYKMGKDSNGTNVATANMVSHESQSEQVWRRIVNNLPALLKSKGTNRSIKSLMSIYGIPSTLISIKEYGGTSLNDEPIFIEDRYHYKLRLVSRRSDGFRTINFELNKGQEFIEPECNLTIFNGDFSRGLLGWGVQVINSGSYPEIDENLGSIDNANAIFCPSAGTILTKNLDLEKNKRYRIQFRTWRPYTPPPDDNTGRFQLEFNGENVILSDGFDEYLYGSSSDEDLVWTMYLVGSEENLLEIYTFDDNISFWEFKIEEVPFPERYPDTYEFRFQYHELQGEDGDLFDISSYSPMDVDYFNFVKFRLPVVGENKRKLIIINEDNVYSEIILHESDEINFEPNEFYTFRLYRDLEDPTKFYYNLANSSNSLLGEINNEISGSFISSELLNENYNHILTFEFISGYIQGYKEYFGNYSYATFKEHVLNPASYSTDEYNGAYNRLFTYYPFGLDLQKFGHESASHHPSSQPNRNFTSSIISMTGFSEDQSLNYYNDSETYYIDSPMLGGRNIYSKKIRIDDAIIENAILNTNSKVKQSENYFNADSNKLAIVFSLADQINRDIFNHVNGDDLNNSIGDPADEFNDTYSNLDNLRRRYFKKYQNRNDINIFIRLLSAYDYSFFEQIKQLTPGSANLISGILIEPHILEKNKQIILKPIEISNENIEIDYNLDIQNEYGSLELLETEVTRHTDLNSRIEYLKAIISRHLDLRALHNKLNTTIRLENSLDANYLKMLKGNSVSIRPVGSGNLEMIVETPRNNCKYLEKIYNYTSETRPEYSIYKYLDVDDAMSSANANGYEYSNVDSILNLDKRPFARYLKFEDSLLAGGGPISVTATFENISLPVGTYIGRFYIEWVDGSSIVDDNARAKITMTSAEFSHSAIIGLKHTISTDQRVINPYLIEIDVLDSSTVDIEIELSLLDGINCSSVFRLYGFDIYEDIGMYSKEMIMLNNRLNDNYQFTLSKPSSYQIDEESSANNKRFGGSKISSPGWNLPSTDTYNQSPVVTFNIVDPNILTINPLQDSNLKVN
jgi:hypothetical protein